MDRAGDLARFPAVSRSGDADTEGGKLCVQTVFAAHAHSVIYAVAGQGLALAVFFIDNGILADLLAACAGNHVQLLFPHCVHEAEFVAEAAVPGVFLLHLQNGDLFPQGAQVQPRLDAHQAAADDHDMIPDGSRITIDRQRMAGVFPAGNEPGLNGIAASGQHHVVRRQSGDFRGGRRLVQNDFDAGFLRLCDQEVFVAAQIVLDAVRIGEVEKAAEFV